MIRFIFSLRFLVILGVLVLALLAASNALSFRLDPDDISEAFHDSGYQPRHHFIPVDGGKLHYVSIGDTSKQPVLLIHGSPGTWDNFVSLVSKTDFLKKYFAIIPDRPGYGGTDIPPDQSLELQASYFGQLVHDYFNENKGVVAGHSYGAAVALELATQNPRKVAGVVSIAGTIAHPYQPRRWYNYVVKYSPVKHIIKDELVTSNKEMWALTAELSSLAEEVGTYPGRAAFISAGDDFLVDERSAPYVVERMDSANTHLFFKEDLSHFVIWTDKNYVIQAIDWAANSNSK